MAVIDSGETSDLRTRFQFSHGLRLEVFYALQALTDSSDIHQSWRQAASEALPEEFYRAFAALGNTPILWPLLADAPGTIDASVSFQQLMDSLQTLDLDTFREGILVGALHDRDVVVDLVEGHLDLAAAIDRAPEHKKHLWYTCVGLYPYDEHAAVPLALQRALHDPEGFRTDALLCLNLFWEHVFAATWEGLEPELLRSVREKRRLFEALSVSEFLEQAIMRLEIDEERQVLRSLRGGCEIPSTGCTRHTSCLPLSTPAACGPAIPTPDVRSVKLSSSPTSTRPSPSSRSRPGRWRHRHHRQRR